MKFLSYIFFVLFFLLVFLLLVFFLSFSFLKGGDDKGGSFECGFQPFSGLGYSFSMPFFLISLMFLLFDVEVLLLCFFPMVCNLEYYGFYFVWLILFLVLFSTVYEWLKGILSWL